VMSDNQLGNYLKDRRARLDPAAFGFPSTRRRTPGLRREEVAQRANVSTTWYSWLEQGRGGAPSANVLDRIARALMLMDVEREHLFLLALGRPPEVRYQAAEGVTPRLQRVLDALEQAIYARSRDALTGLVHHSDRGTQGEFNRSLQQLYKEKLQWVLQDDVDLIERDAAPSVHQVVRRRDVVNIDKSSGRRSRADCRAGMPHWKPAYRNRLERGGSARMAACHRPT